MGYTHYWKITDEIGDNAWAAICEDAEKLLAQSPCKLAWEYDEPTRPPQANEAFIQFNGVGDDGHETLLLERSPEDFVFCKTAQKPYDQAVCAILAVAAGHSPLIQVSSDGDMDDWKPALEWASQVLGRPVTISFSR